MAGERTVIRIFLDKDGRPELQFRFTGLTFSDIARINLLMDKAKQEILRTSGGPVSLDREADDEISRLLDGKPPKGDSNGI